MPILQEIRALKLVTGQVVDEEWFARLSQTIEKIAYRSAITYEGWVYSDLVPHEDLVVRLGRPELKFKTLEVGSVHAAYEVTIAGDPILPAKPYLIGYQVGYVAPEFTDVFDPDLIANYDGKVRFKFTTDANVVAYTKWIPYVYPTVIVAALKEAAVLSANAWYEVDFTLVKNDKVNFRIVPGATVTIFVYNIPQA